MTSQLSDIFTKGLHGVVFSEFRSSLNVRSTDNAIGGVLEYLMYMAFMVCFYKSVE